MQKEVIRVVHVVWSLSVGGIGKVVLDLMQAQHANPLLQVTLLIGGQQKKNENTTPLPDTTVRLNLKTGSTLSFKAFNQALQLFKQTDIVHIHSFNPLIALAAKKSGARVIYSEHGNFGFGKQKTIAQRVLYFLQRRFLNHNADTILFNSNFTLKTAKQLYGLNDVPCEVIYNGITFPYIPAIADSDVTAQLRKDAFIIGCIARFAGVKRLDRLLTSFAMVAKDKNVQLLLIGDGPLKESLIQQAATAGILNNILFAGVRQNGRDYYPLMDVCALPSSGEAFGLTAIEAWDAGKPVLAFADGGGLTELVEQVEPADLANDEKGLADRISYYYQKKDVADITSSEKRKKFAALFDIQIMERKIYNIYSKADVRN